MALWLMKQEPDEYSFTDLERDGETAWDGIANALALKHLREMRPGDEAFFYHTGKEKAIVGVMQIVSDPYTDPNEDDEKLVVVRVKPIRRLPQPVTLAQIKADEAFADWELVRMARLSVMPVSLERWKKVLHLSNGQVEQQAEIAPKTTKKSKKK